MYESLYVNKEVVLHILTSTVEMVRYRVLKFVRFTCLGCLYPIFIVYNHTKIHPLYLLTPQVLLTVQR